MIGDTSDMAGRLRAGLPTGWFADDAPILNALLSGIGSAWAWIYALIDYAQQQTRLATASAGWLDLIAWDLGGPSWVREGAESDARFRERIRYNTQRLRGTRAALVSNITALTGRSPQIFEPANAADTGGFNTGQLAWNFAGGWGTLSLPFQCFVIAYRPSGGGIANVGGLGGSITTFALGAWNTGALAWGDAELVAGTVTDQQIMDAIVDSLPAATIAWTALSN